MDFKNNQLTKLAVGDAEAVAVAFSFGSVPSYAEDGIDPIFAATIN
jgi:hypothetical protein